MKRIILSLFAILTAIFTYAGNGTKENPMTVADVLAASMDESTVWVKGYIVGNINGAKMENIQFAAEGASAINIALADAWNEKNVANCIPVQLPSGEIRNAINLKDNPGNLGKELLIQAQLVKYFGQNGLKNAVAFELNGSNDYEAPLTNGQGAWTIENTVLPNDLITIWSQSSSYGMKASAYANSTMYTTMSYLVSPTLVLGRGCVLTFEHVQRYSADDPSTQLSLWIRMKGSNRWTEQLPIPNYSDGTNWTFVSSGNIDLSAYEGKAIQLGFRYTSSSEYAATWEIKNVKVTNAKTAEEGPILKDISNTPQTAYTIAKAVEIIQNREGNDMSKEVYTKGVIREIKSLNPALYPRAQYLIGDNTTEDQIQVYNGYYIGGADFTADDQIKVGDEVIVYGRLTLYNTTYEIGANNYIYSLNGKATIDDNPDPQPVEVTKTIAEVQAGENGKVKVEGTVVAVCARGAVIGDATGYIYVYDQNFASEVGDQVTVEGTTSTYGGFKQFSASAGYELTKTGTTTVSYPEPVVMDGAAMDAWIAAPAIQYVQYTGKLSVSGNYFNVIVDGAQTAIGTLVYPTDEVKRKLRDGEDVTIIGYTIYMSGSKYVNTIVTSVVTNTSVTTNIIAHNYTRNYGDANPNFEYTVEGGELDGVPEIICEAIAESPVGTYPIIIKYGSIKNANCHFINGTLTIKPAPLRIKANDISRVYYSPNPSTYYFSYSGFVNNENEQVLTQKPAIETEATITSNVGKYDILPNGAKAQNYDISYERGKLTITPRMLTVTSHYSREYGENTPNIPIEYSGFVNNEDENVISTKPIANTTATKTSPVGEYSITISGGRATNYEFTYEPGVLTITPAPVIAFVNDAERLYGQENPDFSATYAGLKNSERQLTFTEPPIFHTEATKTSGVGKYSVTVSGKAKNYVIAEVDPGTLTINPAPLTIKVNDISRVYYSPNPSTYYFSYSGFVNNDNEQVLTQRPSIKTDATQTSDAGKYVILPENAKAKNYDISYEPGVLTINKRLLKATVNDARREYGEENPNFSISYSGFVNNENESVLTQKPTISVNASRSSNVGSYLVSVSGGSSKNYEINCENGVLVVEKAPLTARVDDVSKIYGQNNPPFTITYEGLKNGEKSPKWEKALEFKTVATAESGVGQHYISASGTPVNYNLKSVESGILTITPAPLTIKAKGASRMYYEDDPDFSFTCSGFVNSDNESVLTKNPTYTTDATKTSNVGKYSITPSGAAAKNYEISYEQGELTITKRPLKVTSHSSREYGEENPQFPLEYDGFVNYEDASVITSKPTASTAATRRSNVGEYPITLRGGEAKNYEISCIPGTLTVTKAPLTVKVNDETKVYGAQNPSFSLSFDGLKNDEAVPAWATRPTIQTEATRYSDVGQYDIKVSGGVAVNYETQMMDGILDIRPAALTIRANDASRLYYDEEPAFSYTCNGFVNGDGEDALSAKPVLSTNATKKSDAGEYDITPSGADSHNYAISYVKGTLRVRPRTLTASVGDYERKYNEENPAFAVTYDGFVGNEDERVLTTKPTARTAATKTSDVGTYRIDVAGGEAKNYGFSYVPGRLTINKAEQSIAWNQDFRGLRVGDQVELKATASSGLQVTYSMESYEPAEIYTAGTTYWLDCKAEGETQIVAVQEGNRNYYATNRIRKPLIVGPVAIVEAEDGSLVKIQSTQLGIRVTGAKPGENIRIYTLDGMLQRSVRVEEPTTYIQMKRNNIYIVRVGEKVVKLRH